MSVYQLKTFGDLVTAVREECGIQSTDITSINRIKRDLNIIHQEVASKKSWWWLSATVDLEMPAFVSSGTVNMVANTADVTLSLAPTSSKTGYLFAVDGYTEIYTIESHAANSTTLRLKTPYSGGTGSALGYRIWTNKIALPTLCKEVQTVWHDHYNKPLEDLGHSEFRRVSGSSPRAEGSPSHYFVGDFRDPGQSTTIASLPALSTRSSAGVTKTLVFSAALPTATVAKLVAGEPVVWAVANAGAPSYNGTVVISGLSTTNTPNDTVSYSGYGELTEPATSEPAATIKLFGTESDGERFRELYIFPAMNSARSTLHVDMERAVVAMDNDKDEPIIPMNDRGVLLYGALARAWQRLRNPESAASSLAMFQEKLGLMAGKLQETLDRPKLTPSASYLGAKRNTGRRSFSNYVGAGSGGGSGGSSVVTGSPNTVATFGPTGEIQSAGAVSSTKLGYISDVTGPIQAQLNAISATSGVNIGQLNAEIAARTAGDSTNAAGLAQEIIDRASADTIMAGNIANETSYRTTADNTLTFNLSNEASARASADTTLTTNLATETTNRTLADTTLTNNLAAEVTNRTNGDITLTTNLSNEVTNRTNADTTLTTNLAAEVTNRATADTTLTTNLATEVTNRTNGDSTLTTNLSAHTGSTAAHGATGAVVGTTNTQTLTNKTLTAPAITAPTGIVKADVGLSNVDNTSDVSKNSAVATLTNKTITAPLGIVKADVGLSNVDNTSDVTKNAAAVTLTNKTLTAPIINAPTGIVKADVGLSNVDNTSDITKNAATATLTNKTITTPLGIVKGDVGLGNVDNTSDASKNSATATLTNKTLTTPVITAPTGIVKADVGLSNVDNTSDVAKNAATATLTNKTLTAPAISAPTGIVKADVGLSNVDNTSDASKNSAVATLTNKTINANNNTITNISDAQIAAGALISYSKLSLSTGVSAIELNYSTGVTSSIQTQLNAKLSNPLTTKGDLLGYSTVAARVPVGSDGQVLVGDAASAAGLKWATLQQGAKNYISYNNFENNLTTGWSLFNASLTGLVVTGAIVAGAASVNTFATTATNPLAGTYSLQTASSAAWAVGQGFISDPLPIDREDRAKVLNFKASFEVTAGSANINASGTSANTYHVYLYDVANSAWVQPSGVYSFNSYTGQVSGSFQTASNATSYRLAVICVNASAGAVSINWDDFSLSPGTVVSATAFSDLNSNYTFTSSQTTNATLTARSARRAQSLFVKGGISFTGANTQAAGITLPGGLTIDTSANAENDGSNRTAIGKWVFRTNSGTLSGGNIYQVTGASNTTVLFQGYDPTVNSPSVIASGDRLGFTFEVPITGWGSNLLIGSDGGDGRTIAFATNQQTATGTVSGSVNVVKFASVVRDDIGGYSPTTGLYTVTSAGWYRANGVLDLTCTTSAVGQTHGAVIGVNGGVNWQKYGVIQSTSVKELLVQVTGPVYCKAGDTIGIYCLSNTTTPVHGSGLGGGYFEVSKLQGPASIAAGESVNARYYQVAAQTAFTATVQVNFDTKDYDSHNSVTVGAGVWKFIAPVAGKYRYSWAIASASNSWTAGNFFAVTPFKNGVAIPSITQPLSAQSTGTYRLCSSVSDTVQLNAGDYLDIRCGQSVSASLYNNGGVCIAIEKVGN